MICLPVCFKSVSAKTFRPVFAPLLIRHPLAAMYVLAAHVFFSSVKTLPTLVRTWWSEDCDRRYSDCVSKYVEVSVAPVLLYFEVFVVRVAVCL